MLPGMSGVMAGVPQATPGTMIGVIQSLGLSTNLKLCLDAGDISSVASGSQTKWLDVSGNGYDFFRGADATSEASDPTFNGTPGGQSGSEFWSFDGADFFSYDASNETWMNALHKDNAVFSFAFWVYVKDPGGSLAALFGTTRLGVTSGVAAYYSVTSPTRFTFIVKNGGSTAYTLAPSIDLNKDAWNFIGVSIDETANTSAVNINGTAASGTATYSSPASGDAITTMAVGATRTTGELPQPAGSRMASAAIWQGTALSASNLAAIFTADRAKFGV